MKLSKEKCRCIGMLLGNLIIGKVAVKIVFRTGAEVIRAGQEKTRAGENFLCLLIL